MAGKVKARQVTSWLTDVTKWQVANSLEDTLMIYSKLDDLTSFLQQLENTLSKMISVSEALEQLPDVGQLLGRLCGIPTVICFQPIYMSLMKCVLCFIVDNPVTPIEERSKSWALTQIRSTVCTRQRGSSLSIMDQTGHLIKDCTNIQTEQILKAVKVHYKPCERSWNETLQCFVPCIVTQLPESTPNITTMCLKLYHKEPFRQLLDVIVDACYSSSDHKMMTEVSCILCAFQSEFLQEKRFKGLNYKVLKILWCSDMSYLETTLLNILEQCVEPDKTLKEMTRIIHRTKLDKACFDDPMINTSVMRILKTNLQQSDNDVRVVNCMWAFRKAIQWEQQQDNYNQHQGDVNKRFPSENEGLWVWEVLQSFSQVSLTCTRDIQLNILLAETGKMYSLMSDKSEYWFNLLQQHHILYLSLYTALSAASKSLCSTTLAVIRAYGYLCDRESCKERVEDFIFKLTDSLKKHKDSISLPVSLTPSQTANCRVCTRGLHKLLMQFLISMQAESTDLAEDILFEVCQGSRDPQDHLETLIQYLDHYIFSFNIIHKSSLGIDKVYIEILCNKLKKEICNNCTNISQTQQVYIDGLFEKTNQVVEDLKAF